MLAYSDQILKYTGTREGVEKEKDPSLRLALTEKRVSFFLRSKRRLHNMSIKKARLR